MQLVNAIRPRYSLIVSGDFLGQFRAVLIGELKKKKCEFCIKMWRIFVIICELNSPGKSRNVSINIF